jgi:hypothetical protein
MIAIFLHLHMEDGKLGYKKNIPKKTLICSQQKKAGTGEGNREIGCQIAWGKECKLCIQEVQFLYIFL